MKESLLQHTLQYLKLLDLGFLVLVVASELLGFRAPLEFTLHEFLLSFSYLFILSYPMFPSESFPSGNSFLNS